MEIGITGTVLQPIEGNDRKRSNNICGAMCFGDKCVLGAFQILPVPDSGTRIIRSLSAN